ncbi:MAG: glycosyltransferase family 2 protein [Deltaproteobacteria bacterium]|nr:MAG: glycosyltransferase family 2 protein [Deltaproteobacteria bacterium]
MRGLVVIPAFDEERSIGEVIDRVREHAGGFDILVVDDCSGDQTGAVARRHGATVVRHPFNLGYGCALQTGYRWALRHGYDLVVQMDGDGQHDGADVPVVARPILEGTADVVYGSRFHEGSTYRMGLLRRIGSRWFAWLVRILTGVAISDPTTGFQGLSARVLELYTTAAFPTDYPDADMIVLLSRRGLRIAEVPVRMHERPESPSMHSGLRVLYYVYKMTLSILMNALRTARL